MLRGLKLFTGYSGGTETTLKIRLASVTVHLIMLCSAMLMPFESSK